MTKGECPVCGKTNLAEDLAQCPQCDADLECFRLLEDLYEHPAPGAGAQEVGNLSRNLHGIETSLHSLQDGLQRLQRAARRRAVMLILVVVIAIGALFLYQHRIIQPWLADQVPSSVLQAELVSGREQEKELRQAIVKAVAGIVQVIRQLAVLEQRVAAIAARQPAADTKGSPAPKPDQDPGMVYHELQKNETLWGIARQYYQQGRLYPVLLEMNPGLGIYFELDYGKIRIFKDRQAAEDIFKRLVFTRGSRDFFRYQVQAEDTWEKISARFYGRAGDEASLQALNADTPLRPGTRVTVPLPE
jgi:LysM repeat protein